MTLIYIGEGLFNSNMTFTSFDVVENSTDKNTAPSLLKTVIFAPQVTTTYNGNGYLILTIKDENANPVKSVSVEITIDGKTKAVTTDANGVAKLSTNGLAPKTYTANMVFKGDGTYANSSATANVVVNKAASKIIAKKKTFKKAKKTKKYTITLKSGKYAIKKVKVTLKVKGKPTGQQQMPKAKRSLKSRNCPKKANLQLQSSLKATHTTTQLAKKLK